MTNRAFYIKYPDGSDNRCEIDKLFTLIISDCEIYEILCKDKEELFLLGFLSRECIVRIYIDYIEYIFINYYYDDSISLEDKRKFIKGYINPIIDFLNGDKKHASAIYSSRMIYYSYEIKDERFKKYEADQIIVAINSLIESLNNKKRNFWVDVHIDSFVERNCQELCLSCSEISSICLNENIKQGEYILNFIEQGKHLFYI